MGALQTIIESLGGVMPEIPVSMLIGSAVGLVIAALMCFLGFRLLRVFVAIAGLFAGAVIGILLGDKIANSNIVTLILVIIFAIGLCLISFLVYKAGIFIMTFFTIFSILAVILPGMTLPLDYRLIALIAAAVFGILSVILVRPFTIIATSLGGGMAIASNIAAMIAEKLALPEVLVIVVGMVLAVLGMIVQFRTSHGKGKRR